MNTSSKLWGVLFVSVLCVFFTAFNAKRSEDLSREILSKVSSIEQILKDIATSLETNEDEIQVLRESDARLRRQLWSATAVNRRAIESLNKGYSPVPHRPRETDSIDELGNGEGKSGSQLAQTNSQDPFTNNETAADEFDRKVNEYRETLDEDGLSLLATLTDEAFNFAIQNAELPAGFSDQHLRKLRQELESDHATTIYREQLEHAILSQMMMESVKSGAFDLGSGVSFTFERE